MGDEPKSIREQAKLIEQDCERAAIRDALVSAYWDRRNLWLGVLSAITAAIAALLAGNGKELLSVMNGIGPFKGGFENLLVVLFALVSAALSSALTFLAPAKKAESFQEMSHKYHALREKLRLFINSASPDQASPEGEKALRDFIEERREIEVNHPILPEWAYRKAQRRLLQKRIRNRHLKWLESELGKSDYKPPQGAWQCLKCWFLGYGYLTSWQADDGGTRRNSRSPDTSAAA
jgi:hypothetical protein